MKLIKKIEISRFRSIKSATIDEPGHSCVLAGPNNSGKSNVLRALSVFFNGTTEAGQELNVDSDYFRPEVNYKKKKRISVKVYFTLPDEFRFRRQLESAGELLGRNFAIRKEWTRAEREPAIFLNDSEESVDRNDGAKVNQFLSLISFRYVPNRVLPLEVIRREHQALRDVIIRRLGRIARTESQLFESLRETSTRLIEGLSGQVHDVFADVDSVRLATPTSLAEMVFGFGYRLNETGLEFEDALQGSGLQSFLMFQTLHLIDRDYFQRFGWRQAAVWALEEPESSLHTSLEANTASFLSTISVEPKSRLQIFSTSHSDLMIQYAETGFFVDKHDGTSRIIRCSPVEMLEKTSQAGVSRWVHPILYSPLKPLILVEGKTDEAFLNKALTLMGLSAQHRVSYLEQMVGDGVVTGGIDALYQYVKRYKKVIRLRPKTAPIIVVLDWDALGQKSRFENLFHSDDPFRVFVWPEIQCNPLLGTSIHGIERFFSDRLIGLAESRGAVLARNADGVVVSDSDGYGRLKNILAQVVAVEQLLEPDLVHSKSFLIEVTRIAPN
jgi:predicted ATP-dependent endonuclease of OLD family